jgi:hypothetical protein
MSVRLTCAALRENHWPALQGALFPLFAAVILAIDEESKRGTLIGGVKNLK